MIQQIQSQSLLFTKEDLQQLKLDMEVEIGAKLSKISYKDRIEIICKSFRPQCTFQYLFCAVDPELESYRLISYQPQHFQKCCFDEETRSLFAQMLKLNRSKGQIEDIIKTQHLKGNFQKLYPRKLLLLLQGENSGYNFNLYGAVTDEDFKKKLKKKFDNIVNQLKDKILNRARRVSFGRNQYLHILKREGSLFQKCSKPILKPSSFDIFPITEVAIEKEDVEQNDNLNTGSKDPFSTPVRSRDSNSRRDRCEIEPLGQGLNFLANIASLEVSFTSEISFCKYRSLLDSSPRIPDLQNSNMI